MKFAILNLCHTDPLLVARAARRLTSDPGFSMYIHLDAKTLMAPFEEAMQKIPSVFFTKRRYAVYWGGFHAISATIELLRQALRSPEKFDYFILLQNLDYPVRSNRDIHQFFKENMGKEFIRGCRIAKSKDWHYASKYRLFYNHDDDFYLKKHTRLVKGIHDMRLLLKSISTIGNKGRIHEDDEFFDIYYGAAQWAISRECARYIVKFYDTHPKFNATMRHIKFPDEEYFQTIVHNSYLKERCADHDETEKRWLVNWRNLHYFEYPKEVTVFQDKDFDRIIHQDCLFIRKVKTGVSDYLLDRIDNYIESQEKERETCDEQVVE